MTGRPNDALVLTDQRGWTVCKNSWALQCSITNRGARIDRAERSATHAGDPKLPDLGNSSGGSYETQNESPAVGILRQEHTCMRGAFPMKAAKLAARRLQCFYQSADNTRES